MAAKKKRKIRTSFRKRTEVYALGKTNLTKQYTAGDSHDDSASASERISGKGELTRKRTLAGAEVVEDASGTVVLPQVDKTLCKLGVVLRVHGLTSYVRMDDGSIRNCAIRRLLKTISTDQRHVVAAGDRVWVRLEGKEEGIIERVEPRHGVLNRTSRRRQHVIVSNIDQIVIITSAAEPRIKPNLVDRYFVTAERNEIEPVLCINKIDLVAPHALQPIVGNYSQLGYQVICTSAKTGQGMERLRALLKGRQSVVTGQSGVGKSSLLNHIDPSLRLRVNEVSSESQKGKHTTTTSELIPLKEGGFVVDTPGIRQFQLWDVVPEEVAGFFSRASPSCEPLQISRLVHTRMK